ncbi:hypothetical protein [uncultured Sphingomonas sp.]|uniref:hypothetical protein n=1 Tax=uncultured Sphingomonas sp. TaxID=158754 RepID=UPI0035CA5406
MAALDEELAALMDGAYAAALDDCWEIWTERLVAALGGSGGSFVIGDERTRTLTRAAFHSPVSRAIDDYAAGFGALDPQTPAAFAMPAPCVFEDRDYRDNGAGTREYLSWLRGAIGLDHHVALQAPLGDGATRAAVSVYRSVADGPTPTAARERFRAIAPEIARALRLGFRHAALLQQSF